MATGRLGHADLAAGTNTSLYTVPANTFGIVTLSICNRGNSAISVRVAVASAGTPLASEYIEYDVEILANGVLERTGLVLDATKNIVVYADSLGCSAMVFGLETATS